MFYCQTRKSFFSGAWVFFMLVIAIGGCDTGKQTTALFPIDSLVTEQIQLLTNIKAGLFKEALLKGRIDTVNYTPADTTQWVKELDIFRELKVINKPVNTGSYQIDDGLFDQRSNLKVKAFTSTEELPVVYLRVYYQATPARPRRIEALYKKENILFASARLLSMHFEQIDNKTVLTAYNVKGGQKMIFSDSVTFYIKGKILVH
jgi:hypothetical protein